MLALITPFLILSAVVSTVVSSPAPISTGKPVLLLPTVPDCECEAKVVPSITYGGNSSCTYQGNPQPCFSYVVTKTDPADIDENGYCHYGPPPTPACTETQRSCVFVGRTVTVQAAPCAGGVCGTGPFQLYNNDGAKVGSTFGNSESRGTTISIGNQSCESQSSYNISVKDTGNGDAEVFRVKVEAKCCKCAKMGASTICQ